MYGSGGDEEFEAHFEEVYGQPVDDLFGNTRKAACTLIQVMTFDNWIKIVRPIADKKRSCWPYAAW